MLDSGQSEIDWASADVFAGSPLERADDVDPVERVQMVEMDHVVLHVLRRHDEIAQQPGVRRRYRADGFLDGANRGDGVNRGAHAADALGKCPGVARIATAQDQLDAAKHRGRRPCLRDGAAVDFGFDAQMALDPGYRIDNDVGHDLASALSQLKELCPM